MMNLITDFIWLVITVYLEAQGESSEGRVMVCHSILNRAEERNMTIKEVVLQNKQYSCWNEYNVNGKMPAIKYTNDLIDCYGDCLKALCERQNGNHGEGVNHYFNPLHANPSWASDMKFISEIGRHVFYRG